MPSRGSQRSSGEKRIWAIKVVRKPATEERKGINPFTKEEMVIKAKPAKNVVKVTALKGETGVLISS